MNNELPSNGGKLGILIQVNSKNKNDFVVDKFINHFEIEYEDGLPADYVIAFKRDEPVVSVGIIRKSVEEYVNSILDQSLHEQLYHLSSMYAYAILVIEGYLQEALVEGKITRQALLTSIASSILKNSPVEWQSRISVIMLETNLDTADFVFSFANKIDEEPFRIPTKPKSNAYSQLALFSVIPGIGQQKAIKLAEKFIDFDSLIHANSFQITEIEGFGIKTAKRILDFIKPQVIQNAQN